MLGLAPLNGTRQERKKDYQREKKSAELPDIAATLRLIKERRSVMHKDMTGERVRWGPDLILPSNRGGGGGEVCS